MKPLNIKYIKVEKANTVNFRYQKLRKITNLFRIFEFFLILAVISKASFQLPFALFKLLNECIHNFCIFLVSPTVVFILGNAIIITIFINSGQFHSSESNKKTSKTRPQARKSSRVEQKYVKEQEKSEENTMVAMIFSTSEHQVIKIYHRSQSEKVNRGNKEKNYCGLRRSNTAIKSLKDAEPCKEVREGYYSEDHMSSDEFRRTIEDFIAKQQKFLREEECTYSLEE